MLDGYTVLASVYDGLNEAVDYEAWADFIDASFSRFSPEKKIRSVLDLGCGTGSMTLALAKRGYDMTALDISEEMLSVAECRARENASDGILFILGDMCSFELYGTVDAVVCCLDGINHLAKREDLLACFSLVSNYLEDGGLFLFDLNTPYKFRNVYDGRDYILEDEGVMCCWRNVTNAKKDVVDFYLTVFRENTDGTWSREDGGHRERAYGLRAIENALSECGLEICGVFGGYGFEKPEDTTERWYVAARKK